MSTQEQAQVIDAGVKTEIDQSVPRTIASVEKKEIQLGSEQYNPTYKTYQIKREEKFSITGNTFKYTLMESKKDIMASKCKGRYPNEPMPIITGKDVHLSKAGEYYLFPGKEATTFELRKDSRKGTILMTSNIVRNPAEQAIPRSIVASLVVESNKMELITKKPKKNSSGFYTLNFHGKKTIPSEKNSIYVMKGDVNASEVLSVRKIATNKLEVIADSTIPPVMAFALGLTSFIGNFSS